MSNFKKVQILFYKSWSNYYHLMNFAEINTNTYSMLFQSNLSFVLEYRKQAADKSDQKEKEAIQG